VMHLQPLYVYLICVDIVSVLNFLICVHCKFNSTCSGTCLLGRNPVFGQYECYLEYLKKPQNHHIWYTQGGTTALEMLPESS